MPAFSDAWLAELKSKNDIVSLVSEYVDLRKKGKRFWGCCPFHTEKTPSFSVSPDNQMFYCFGCHAGGGMVQFVMQIERLQYAEAIALLARRANMEMPDEINSEKLRNDRARKERLYTVCKDAALFYHRILFSADGAHAREYLSARGIDLRTCKRFGLGYAPDGFEYTLNYLRAKGHSDEDIVHAGLANKGRDGRAYDAYRDRIVFPIVTTMTRVVGFGARTLRKDVTPKYINTGETQIYYKRDNVYGLNLLRGRQLADIIVTEGYLDVISLHANGVDNAVASLGTALTDRQARLIRRYADKIYLAYDGDAAGRAATLKAADVLAKEGVDVRVIVIPDELDPDDFIRQRGKQAFLDLKYAAITATEFKLSHAAREYDMSDINDREKYAKRACAIIANLEPVARPRYIEYVAKLTGLPINSIREQCQAGERGETENNAVVKRHNREKTVEDANLRDGAEALLLSCMAASRESAYIIRDCRLYRDGDMFASRANSAIARQLIAAYDRAATPDVALILSGLEEDASAQVVKELDSPMNATEADVITRECLTRLEVIHLQERKQQLLEALKVAAEVDKPQLLKEIGGVIQRIDALRKV
ncbi:MAG: DNA primase [Clostridia bacterium]|nr:DNA primase [Clostridia bacterium]